jgi:hypothetical protein
MMDKGLLKIMADSVILRKWHEGNQKFEECTLQELWENGFHCGQSFQEFNKHWHKEAIPKGEFYATHEFLQKRWEAFWHDLSKAEIIIQES